MLFELLNQLDGLGDDADVAVLLTSNRPDLLEPALAARPGRVDLAVEVPLPDAPSRRRLLDVYGRVARTLLGWARLAARAPEGSLRAVEVNGGPGALYLDAQQRLLGAVALEVAGRQVNSIHAIVNPDKLTHLGPVGDFGSLWGSAR